MYLILFVLHEPSKLREVMDAWTNAGVSGITVLPSSGYKKITSTNALRDDLPLIPNIDDLLMNQEKSNRTLMTIVKDDGIVDQVIEVTQNITGNLDLPNTGILAVLPVARAYGLNRIYEDENSGS